VDQHLSGSRVDDEPGLDVRAALEGDAQLDAHPTEGSRTPGAVSESESAGPESRATFQMSIAVRRNEETNGPD
jgi:hypothetical protein